MEPVITFEAIDGETWKVTTIGKNVIKEIYSEPVVVPKLYVDIAFSDPDGIDNNGVVNDGIGSIDIAIDLRTEEEELLPVTDKFRIIVRDSDNKVCKVMKVAFVDGQASFNFKTTMGDAILHIDPKDLNIPGYDFEFIIRGDNKLFVYDDQS